MSRAIPNLVQGFTGVSLPKFGPRQMGNDLSSALSVITFLNQVTESAASLHDNQTDTRPDYLPVNGLWCYTDPGGNKVVYQYDGTTDVELWTVKDGKSSSSGGNLPLFAVLPFPVNTVQEGFLSVCVDNGILTESSYPDAYAQLVAMQTADETNIVTMAEYAAEMTAQGGVCGRFSLDTDTQTFRIPCAPGTFWRGVSGVLGLDVGAYQIDQMRPIEGQYNYTAVGSSVVHPVTPILTGSFEAGDPVVGAIVTGSGSGYCLKLNTALLGPHYSGTETAPLHVVTNYQMKIR